MNFIFQHRFPAVICGSFGQYISRTLLWHHR